MNKELKSLIILSLFTLPVGAKETLADGPGRTSAASTQQSVAAMGDYAGPERTQAAIGHYARARTLLVEAMREFDAGKEIARPDLILNSETWKAGVSARADELGHIISPQARETTGGVRFKENNTLLKQDLDKPKKVASTKSYPKTYSTKKKVEKKQILVSAEKREENLARAKMTEHSDPLAVETTETKSTTTVIKEPLVPVIPNEAVESPEAKKAEDEKDLNELLAPPKTNAKVELEKSADSELSKTMGEQVAEDKAPPSDEPQTTGPAAEESETAKSINDDEIRARLKKLSEEIAQEEKSKH